MASVHLLLDILTTHGHRQYGGEAVTQQQHALQCATLAERAFASPGLIVACLFHDIGHLVHTFGEDLLERNINDRHEDRAIPYLRQAFPATVTEPVRLHVNAKRYLCAVDQEYWESLSLTSKRSLKLQGGIFSEAEAKIFINQPYAKDAVQLRIWDDLAKDPAMGTPDLVHFLPIIQRCQRPPSPTISSY